MGSDERLQTGLFFSSQDHWGSQRNGHCRDPYDKSKMAKHHTMVPPILHVVYAQSTGTGLTKWTSSSVPRGGSSLGKSHAAIMWLPPCSIGEQVNEVCDA